MSGIQIRVGCDCCDRYVFKAAPVPINRLEEYRLAARQHLLSNDLWMQPCARSETRHHIIRQTETSSP